MKSLTVDIVKVFSPQFGVLTVDKLVGLHEIVAIISYIVATICSIAIAYHKIKKDK